MVIDLLGTSSSRRRQRAAVGAQEFALEALGHHEVRLRKPTSGLHGVALTPGGLEGGAMGREGVAVGDSGGGGVWPKNCCHHLRFS